MSRQSTPAPDASGITAVASGHGPDVVLVHGILGDYRQWFAIADQLKDLFRVVSLSRRYHWPSTERVQGQSYSYEHHRDDLIAYMRLYTGPVHLVGHSYGAGLALLAACTEPWLVHTLTLIEPALHSLLPAADADLKQELESRKAMIDEVRNLVQAEETASAARAMIDWTQGGPVGFAALSQAAQAGLIENAHSLGPTLATPQPHIGCDDLRRLSMPALVVHGERTRLYYRLIADVAAACIPAAARATIAGASHMSIVERPGEVADVLRRFMTRY